MSDAFKTIQDGLDAIREEGRQAGYMTGYEQGWDKGYAAAMAHIRELVDEAKPPVRPGAPKIGDLFTGDLITPERKRRKRGENNDVIISALNRAGRPVGASDLRRIIEGLDGVNIPYSSIRHSLLGLQDKGLVTVENDLWSVVVEGLEPV